MLQHYIKTAFRHLLKYKTQNLISILGLSVGILCFSICLYCSRFIYSVDQCFTNKERIANVNLYTPDGDIYSGIPANLIERACAKHQLTKQKTTPSLAIPVRAVTM